MSFVNRVSTGRTVQILSNDLELAAGLDHALIIASAFA